jgi:outer membrane protein OmpA-like peptidoglycan-associated protein
MRIAMSKILLSPTSRWFGTILLLFPFFLGGCSLLYPEIRYDENTRIYNEQADDNPGTSTYTVGRYDNTASGPRTHKYTIGKYDEATDYYVNRQKNSDINPRPAKNQVQNFPADMTPEEQRASLTLVIEVSNVLFEFDKWVIKADFVPEIDRWVEYFKNNPLVTANIYGHADSTGPETYNQKLSERRAEAVVNYMVDRGIQRERLTTKGFGETQPAVSNDTREGRQKNRRVELNF